MRKLCLALLLLGLLAGSQKAIADNYIFVSLDWPPLEYVGENGEPTGIVVDIVKNIMGRLGHTVDIRIYPWARSMTLVKEGKADAIFTVLKNAEREKYLDYSREILAPQTIFFYKKKDRQISFNGELDELKRYRIGVVSTISYGQKFDTARSFLNIQRVATIEQNFEKIVSDRIDLTISNVYVGDYALKQSKYASLIEKIPTPVQKLLSYIAFSKKRNLAALRDQFDAELLRMKQSGEFQKALNQFDFDI